MSNKHKQSGCKTQALEELNHFVIKTINALYAVV